MPLPGETSLGHGGPQSPTSSSCTSPACCQGTTHSQKPGCRPGPSHGSATALLVTRAVWPKGTTCGCAAGVQGTTLVPPRVTQGRGGTKARGPHLREEAGVPQGLGMRQPLPQPQRLKDISVPVLDLILILEKKKKKKRYLCFEVGTVATPSAALPQQGPVSSARSLRSPHPPGRLPPSRALATAALLLLVGGPGGAQQLGAKEPALCPGDPHTGLHWVATERSCPAWGT